MCFKAEIVFFSICHAVEWNFGAGFVSDTDMQTLCAKLVTRTSCSCVPWLCILSTVTLTVSCWDPTRGSVAEPGPLRRLGAASPRFCVVSAHGSVLPPEFEALEAALAGACLSPEAAHTALHRPGQPAPLVHPIRPWPWPPGRRCGAPVLLPCHEGKWRDLGTHCHQQSDLWLRLDLWRRFSGEGSACGWLLSPSQSSQERRWEIRLRSESFPPILESPQYFLRNLRSSSREDSFM